MTSIRDLLPLEQISSLDLNLPQRWARKALTRAVKFAHRYSGMFGAGGQITEISDVPGAHNIIGGLEVALGGSTLYVTPGQLLFHGNPNVPGAFLTRPGAYTFQDTYPGVTPARPEADDDVAIIYDNAYFAQVPYIFMTPTTVEEWWVVYAERVEVTTETDTGRVTFNQITGAWDAASQPKVTKRTLVYSVARGAASAGMPAVPVGAIPLAALHLYAGESDLTNASVFDLRKMRHPSREPNEVGGAWRVYSYSGFILWHGEVHAHLNGERLEARAMGGGVEIGDLCSPGATWDATASPTNPKIAWLYLARSGLNVPRLKQIGNGPLADSTTTGHNFYQQGVLVLSPVPPKVGLGPNKNTTAGRWDLRSSASIALPSYRNDASTPRLVYNFAGQTAPTAGAICVGMMVYDGLSGGKPTVKTVDVDAGGWMRGDAMRIRSRGDEATNPIAFAVADSAGLNIRISVTRGTVGGFSVPFDGVQVVHWGPYRQARVTWHDGGFSGTDGTDYIYFTDRFTASFPALDDSTLRVATGTLVGVISPTGPNSVLVGAVRFPYGQPLYT